MDAPFSDSDLFKEIGDTLGEWSKGAVQGGVAQVRTVIAREAINSPEGQAVVAQYKMQTLIGYLPWIIAGVVVIFLAGRFIKL